MSVQDVQTIYDARYDGLYMLKTEMKQKDRCGDKCNGT